LSDAAKPIPETATWITNVWLLPDMEASQAVGFSKGLKVPACCSFAKWQNRNKQKKRRGSNLRPLSN